MTMSMGSRMEEMQVQEEKLDTAMALSEIRTQLQELTKSVESCQSEVNKKKFFEPFRLRMSNFSLWSSTRSLKDSSTLLS